MNAILRLNNKNVNKSECTFHIGINTEAQYTVADKYIYFKYDNNIYWVVGNTGWLVNVNNKRAYWGRKRFMEVEAKNYIKKLPAILSLYGV